MPTKINKIARELNVGVSTAEDFLLQTQCAGGRQPNARHDDHAVELLFKEYSKDKDFKERLDQALSRTAGRKAQQPAPAAPAPASGPRPIAAPGPKVVGKVTLDRKGNVVTPPRLPRLRINRLPPPRLLPPRLPSRSRSPNRSPNLSWLPPQSRSPSRSLNPRLLSLPLPKLWLLRLLSPRLSPLLHRPRFRSLSPSPSPSPSRRRSPHSQRSRRYSVPRLRCRPLSSRWWAPLTSRP